MKYEKFIKISNAVGEGFFADRVVTTLGQEKSLDKENREVLETVLGYIERIECGRNHVSTAKLDKCITSPLKDIEAYHKAIISFSIPIVASGEEIDFIEKFNKKIETMKKEAQDSLKSNKINPTKVKNLLDFFSEIRTESLFEGSGYLKPEAPRWMQPLQ